MKWGGGENPLKPNSYLGDLNKIIQFIDIDNSRLYYAMQKGIVFLVFVNQWLYIYPLGIKAKEKSKLICKKLVGLFLGTIVYKVSYLLSLCLLNLEIKLLSSVT